MILYVDYLKHFKNFFSIVRLFVSLPDLKNVEQEVGFKFEFVSQNQKAGGLHWSKRSQEREKHTFSPKKVKGCEGVTLVLTFQVKKPTTKITILVIKE